MSAAVAVAESTITNRPNFEWSDPGLAALVARFGSYELVKCLPSERDQNMLLRPTYGGGDADMVVLKVHNASDEFGFVECQTQALERAAANGAVVQRLLRTTDTGEVIVDLPTGADDGIVCRCRMFSFLPGQMLAEAAAAAGATGGDAQAALFAEVGRTAGRVTGALLDFDHPAAHKDFFAWDLCACEAVINARLAYVREDRRPLVEGFLATYASDVRPLLPRMRRSVVHNDPNDYNIVVMGDGKVGMLDFGDMMHTYTCADAAICMAYLLFHCPEGASLAEGVLPFVRNFHSECPLTEDEVHVLFDLAIMRVCTSVCMSAYQSSLEPENEYLLISANPAWALLERLAKGGERASAPALLRLGCGFPEAPAAPAPMSGVASGAPATSDHE